MTIIVERPKSRLLRHCMAMAAAGLAAALSPHPASALTAAEIATYTGADRQAVLEAGAKKEGEVQIYSTQVQSKDILETFNKKYPYIRIEFYRAPGGGSEVARRWVEEYKVGKHLPDIFDGGSTSLPHIAENGGIQPYKSPEMAAMRPEGIHTGPQGATLWANNYESYLSLGFNTDLVPENEAPRTWDDLLNPKWKGKMALPGSNTLGNFVFALVLDKGEDFVRQLAKQEVKVFKGSGRAIANLVVAGEVPMSPAMFDSHIANSRSKGASVDWRALGGVYSTTGGIALAKYPPHPHAAMLYIDFMLSKEGQLMFREIGYGSARKDIEAKSKPSKIYYLGQRPDYAQEFEKWNQFGNRLFGQGVAPPKSAGK